MINTKEAIEEILTEYGVTFTDALAERLMKEITPVEKVGRWIPVSERLPEKDDLYLICFDDGEYELAYFHKGVVCYSGVIAWMPLPDPYKQEVEE